MGNASGRDEGEGSNTDGYEEFMEFTDGGEDVSYSLPMVNSPSHDPRAYQTSSMVCPQVAMSSLLRPPPLQMPSHVSNYRTASIQWRHGGKQVAIIGSWDNWQTIKPMDLSEEGFTSRLMLPSGVYHYQFVVDEQLRYDPESPWDGDGSGSGHVYNTLDLQDYIPEVVFDPAAFEPPPSPASSYDNKPVDEHFFRTPPPDLPQQLQETLLNDPSAVIGTPFSLPKPPTAGLNHLYIQNRADGLPIALSSTFRFEQKYLTLITYKHP